MTMLFFDIISTLSTDIRVHRAGSQLKTRIFMTKWAKSDEFCFQKGFGLALTIQQPELSSGVGAKNFLTFGAKNEQVTFFVFVFWLEAKKNWQYIHPLVSVRTVVLGASGS